jgi:hypothetical protein
VLRDFLCPITLGQWQAYDWTEKWRRSLEFEERERERERERDRKKGEGEKPTSSQTDWKMILIPRSFKQPQVAKIFSRLE